ncbi:hypothetical protein FW781_09345 (plasmid) [Chryseobacterium panacisoli]|uniref:Uncharacterized protein n=1 Tax=Chryseobacterium panacisoli TaxID=1807141 RepID=A0A5D9A0U7_9FLAO|nr:hypothetical protein [Chryseobacterium panacisoli]TZG00113.1 hypothetical protein FW781_09345 [Chryseobacterium panacisoli]
MKNIPSFIVIVFIVLNCSDNSLKTKSMDFGSFKVQAPKDWSKLKMDVYDSNAGIIVTKNNDSIFYDYGPYSNPLEETSATIISKEELKELLKVNPKADTTEFIVIDENSNREDFIKSKITYKKIDGYKAKILEPKKIGKGMTGVYIDSLKTGSLGKIRFNLYGINLNKESQTELLEAIQTLQFPK